MTNCELTDSNYQSSIPFLETITVLPCTDKINESLSKDFLQSTSDENTSKKFSSSICKKSINDSIDIETHTIASKCLNNYGDSELKEKTKNERKMAFRNQGGRIL